MIRSKSALAIAVLFAFACAGAQAAGSGEVTRKGKTTKLPNAYAYRQAAYTDANKMITFIVFSTQPADTVKVNATGDRVAALENQLAQSQVAYVELQIAADGRVEQLAFHALGDMITGGVNEKPVFTRNDDKRIEGSFHSTDEKDKNSDYGGYYDLKFALDIPAAAPAQH